MNVTGVFLAHVAAQNSRKSTFFFSKFNFMRMKKLGNTHYCFDCGGHVGFTPGPNGEPTNHIEEWNNYNPMQKHDPVAHANAVVDGANQYDWADEWLRAKIPSDFPYVVALT